MSEDTKEQHKLIRELYKCHSTLIEAEKALVLFHVGTRFIAVGNDADKLYLKYGWEVSDFIESNAIYSYMNISFYSTMILDHCGVKVITIETDYKYQTNHLSLAEIQQLIDYLRFIIDESSIKYPLINCNVTIEGIGFIRILKLSSININKQSVSILVDNNESTLIVQNREWEFNHSILAILTKLGKIFQEQYIYILDNIFHRQKILKEQQAKNTIIYNIFLNEKKTKSATEIVCVRIQDFFITFDDDTFRVFSVLNDVVLYEIRTMGKRGRYCLLLNCRQLKTISCRGDKVYTVFYKGECSLFQLGLRESFINFGKKNKTSYNNVTIQKKMDGTFSITASYGNYLLPEHSISSVIGGYYLSLPKSLEKDLILAAIARQSYDNIILKQLQ